MNLTPRERDKLLISMAAMVARRRRERGVKLGVLGRDKAMAQNFLLTLLAPEQLEAAYRGDWVARKVVDIPAFDATRAWREWQAEQDQVQALERQERAFGLQRKLLSALTKARLYGGAAMVIGVKGQRFEDELDINAVRQGRSRVRACGDTLAACGWADDPRHHLALVWRAELLPAQQRGGGAGDREC